MNNMSYCELCGFETVDADALIIHNETMKCVRCYGNDRADEEYDNGKKEGYDEGYSEGYDNGYHQGQSYGDEQGYARGHRIGYDEGYEDANYNR